MWDQEVVDLKTMILCAIGIITAARHDVGYFVRAGIYHGITRDEMEAVIMLAGLEAGFPSAGEARRRLDAAYGRTPGDADPAELALFHAATRGCAH